MTRRQAREQAFILLFEKSFQEDVSLDEMIRSAVEQDVLKEDEFSELLAGYALEHLEDIDLYIEKYSRGWRINRIPRVNLAILRVAIAEMLYAQDIPVNVSINEALEIAKIYANPEDVSVINGILGSVSRDRNQHE